MHSCLYEGTVRHHRLTPVEHRFAYGMQFVYLDLDELPALVERGWISRSRWSPRALLDGDHFPGGRSIESGVRELIARECGLTGLGSVRMLTLLRWRGLWFSPLNLYFAFDATADEGNQDGLRAVVAEVSNTPWRERRHYAVAVGANESAGEFADDRSADVVHRFEIRKRMHVSPFMEMEQTYRLSLTAPGESLSVSLENWQAEERRLIASLQLRRRELSRAELRRAAWRYPATPLRVLLQIYFQAWKLWSKKCPLYPHPSKAVAATPATP